MNRPSGEWTADKRQFSEEITAKLHPKGKEWMDEYLSTFNGQYDVSDVVNVALFLYANHVHLIANTERAIQDLVTQIQRRRGTQN